jgi:hypothetical protein
MASLHWNGRAGADEAVRIFYSPLQQKIEIDGGQYARAPWMGCGSADFERCLDLGLLVYFERDSPLRDYGHDFDHQPAYIK